MAKGLMRRTSKGTWYYQFTYKGKRYVGDTGEQETRAAERFVTKLKQEVAKSQSIGQLHEQQRKHLIGDSIVSLEDAVALFFRKAGKKGRSDRRNNLIQKYWEDFASWCGAHYPGVKHLHQITEDVAVAYFHRLTEEGRWVCVKGKRHPLSGGALRDYHVSLSGIMKALFADAGLTINPFEAVPRINSKAERRDIYTTEEIQLINEHATGDIRYIFMVGLHTGLRLGDICLLKWENVSFSDRASWLVGITPNKIKKHKPKPINIPLLPDLKAYLQELLPEAGDNVYINPGLAMRYKSSSNKGYISKLFLKFLRDIGIETHRKVPGRARPVQHKDIHSLRHTFCYVAGMNRVPLSIVQDVLGHMSRQMTEHYNAHSTDADKELALSNLNFLGDAKPSAPPIVPIEKVQELLTSISEIQGKMQAIAPLIDSLTVDNLGAIKPIIKKLLDSAQSVEIVISPIPFGLER